MKIVLAYSGGLDTSIIIPWLKERHKNSEIICVCVDAGQKHDAEGMQRRAARAGAKRLYVVDARQSFVEGYLFPLLRSGAQYERQYLLGTAIARPLQASQQVRIAQIEEADALAHGCTGKGNDQIRFELTYRALAPTLDIIAPWRIWNIKSREDALEYARTHNISLDGISKENIYSRDENMWHISHEGGALEDITQIAPDNAYIRTVSPYDAPNTEYEITISFEQARPVAVNKKTLAPLDIMHTLNACAAQNGIGRSDIIETRIAGIKSRALYETPGGVVLYRALQELEAITLGKHMRALKNYLSDQYADLVYNGKWFSEERRAIDAFMESAAAHISGEITLGLYKGSIRPLARNAKHGLYDTATASFGEGGYAHAEAEGFVNIYGLSTSIASKQQGNAMTYDTCSAEKYELD